LGLTLLVTAALRLGWGPSALLPGLGFGILATALQGTAVALLRPVRGAPLDRFLGRWVMGVGLRFLGVVLFAVAVLVDRVRFPPLPTASAFLGVLIPLLFMELRFSR
jgi:hypothetical protein